MHSWVIYEKLAQVDAVQVYRNDLGLRVRQGDDWWKDLIIDGLLLELTTYLVRHYLAENLSQSRLKKS